MNDVLKRLGITEYQYGLINTSSVIMQELRNIDCMLLELQHCNLSFRWKHGSQRPTKCLTTSPLTNTYYSQTIQKLLLTM